MDKRLINIDYSVSAADTLGAHRKAAKATYNPGPVLSGARSIGLVFYFMDLKI